MAFLQVIDDLFTPSECNALIAKLEKGELEYVDRGIANYYRNIIIDDDLAQRLYIKIRPYLPVYVDGQRVVCLNDHFRFSKYTEGGRFEIHRDGVIQDSNGRRSVMTLNIFLNENFNGGETDFFYDDKTFRYSAKPKPGRGALFYAQQYHCGNKVSGGNKYLLRTDVMVG